MLDEGYNYYLRENYESYVSNFKSIKSKFPKNGRQNFHYDIILHNNLLMCNCLMHIKEWSPERGGKKWNKLFPQFGIIHRGAAMFAGEDSVCDDLIPSLTLVYNCLYWTWIYPGGVLRNEEFVLESLGLVRKSLHYVLDFFQCPCLNDSFNNVKLSVLHLMGLSSAHLLKHPGVHNKLLLEIYLIVGHILLESTHNKIDEVLLIKFTNFVGSLKKIKDLSFSNSQRMHSESEVNIFKFGINKLNATVHEPDVELALHGLGILECLCLLRLNKYESSLGALQPSDLNCEISCVATYLKAHVHMLLGENETSLLFVKELLKHQLPVILKYPCCLLMGIVLSKMNAFDQAQREFLKAEKMDTKNCPTTLLFHMAINHENWLKNHSSSEAISKAYLSLLELLVKASKHAAKERKLSLSADYYSKVTQIQQTPPDAILEKALYMLARKYEVDLDFANSANTFLKLLEVTNGKIKDHTILKNLFEPNPPMQTIFHETIAMLVKSKQFEKAILVCNVALDNTFLRSKEDELIPCLFLAIIECKLGNKTQEFQLLRRCLAIASKAPLKDREESDESLSTVKKLLARVYLQRALHSVSIRHYDAANINFKMALGSNIHDQRVLYQYLRFLIKSGDTNRFELWISHKNMLNDKEEQCSNLALQYLLESNVTNSKIEAISAHFWASDVFDSI